MLRMPSLKLVVAVVALLFGLSLFTGFAYAQREITLRVWTIGPDDASIGRATAFEEAGKRLNKYLEDVGADVRVKVEADFNTVSWASFKQRNLLALQTRDPNQIADIIMTGPEDIGAYATAGYAIPLDDYIARYSEVYNDIFPSLWPPMQLQGQTWAIPRDPSARMVWLRKDVLREIGWTEEQIEGLRARTFAGDFTLAELADLAQQIKDAGIVKYPVIHRPTPGVDWFHFVFNNGGRLEDVATGKLVITKSASLAALEYIYQLTNELQVVPQGMLNWAWPAIHQAFVTREAGIFLTGGNWNWGEWQRSPYNLDEEFMFENILWIPYPAAEKGGEPASVGLPMAQMITSASRNKDLAFLLLTLQMATDLQAESVLASGHLGVRNTALGYAPYANSRYHSEAIKLLEVLRTTPTHPLVPFYWQTFFEAVQAVETGIRPEAALNFFISKMQQELGDNLIVEE